MAGRREDPTMLRAVTEVLRRRGTEGWLVGGSVRDRQLGRPSPDLDVAVADDAQTVAEEVAATLGSPWFSLSERYPTYRVLGPGGDVDVSAVRGGSIVDDLALRDFTVNAMASPLTGEGLVDPFGGAAHLREGRLVAVSGRIFEDDPLRLMRASRFSHVLGLKLDEGLAGSIRAQAATLSGTAAERIANEMTLTLAAGRAAEAARMWNTLGLLSVILPEVPLGRSLERSFWILEALDDLLADPEAWFPGTGDLLRERLEEGVDGATSRPVALRLAAMTCILPAARAEAAGRRLRLSGALVSLLRTVSGQVRSALEDATLGRVAQPIGQGGTGGAKRAAVLFLWEAAPWEPEVIILAATTAAAGIDHGPTGALGAAGSDAFAWTKQLVALWAERTVSGVPDPPFNGETLMRELGLEGGPLLGQALREARLAWEAGEATTMSGALAAARRALETR